MKNVAIVAEYNPFHTGHAYQIQRIREEFGADATVIALMSGTFVQRGDIAVADKWVRAEAAVRGGVDLVLELPFPYSMAGAEFYATAAVRLLRAIGGIDLLSFGSESGDLPLLLRTAENMQSDAFRASLRAALKENREGGYAKTTEDVYRSVFSEEMCDGLFRPNNILALEYLKALAAQGGAMRPHTVKREGADYTESGIVDAGHQSATAIRNALKAGDLSALSYLPEAAAHTYRAAIRDGVCPADAERLSPAILSFFRLNPTPTVRDLCDATGGLYTRLAKKSREATGIHSLATLSETKKYTNARIRRVMWFSFFGVTSSEVSAPPSYTQVLALNGRGQSFLKAAKRTATIPILTKPSDLRDLPPEAIPGKRRADVADEVAESAMPKPRAATALLRHTPFLEK